MNKIKPVHIDGLLVMAIACCGFAVSYFDNDESFKYVNPVFRYWLIFSFGFVNAGCGALLFLRKNSYSEHRQHLEAQQNLPLLSPANSANSTSTENKTQL